ncbi:MAG: hypothetical protein ABJB05_00055 [Parafilimonas sp.]
MNEVRILSGGTFRRILYTVIGTLVIIQSIMQHQWFGILFGAYFASMGIFAFGCAAGNCFEGKCNVQPRQSNKVEI